jgi:hypothetical protein
MHRPEAVQTTTAVGSPLQATRYSRFEFGFVWPPGSFDKHPLGDVEDAKHLLDPVGSWRAPSTRSIRVSPSRALSYDVQRLRA